MIQCTDCGIYLPDSAEVCTNCGTPVASALVSQTSQAQELQITKQKRILATGTLGMVLVVIGSLLTFGFFGLAAFFMGNPGVFIFMFVVIIIACLGIAAFRVGTSSKGVFPYVAVSILSASGLIIFGLFIILGIIFPYDLGILLILIGSLLGLIAGISGIRYKLGPRSTHVKQDIFL